MKYRFHGGPLANRDEYVFKLTRYKEIPDKPGPGQMPLPSTWKREVLTNSGWIEFLEGSEIHNLPSISGADLADMININGRIADMEARIIQAINEKEQEDGPGETSKQQYVREQQEYTDAVKQTSGVHPVQRGAVTYRQEYPEATNPTE